jgi:tryptophanyl-tRNA synthetase
VVPVPKDSGFVNPQYESNEVADGGRFLLYSFQHRSYSILLAFYMNSIPSKKRVLSGITPSSFLTLGNYIGAIQGWVQRQSENENFLFVANMHAHTLPQKPEDVLRNTLNIAAAYIACGLDPKHCTLFVQSQVRAHVEAGWLLMCLTPLGWLNKMTQFKEKSANQDSVGSGLLMYPVLMAADILLYQPDEVPVGEDQKQHIELARNLGERFNHLFGPTFKIPAPRIPEVGARIMGLDNPLTKMSKSSAHNPGHAIFLSDDDDTILKAFKRATTDSGKEIIFSDADEKAGVNNLLTIYKCLTGKSKEECERDFVSARGYGDLKVAVAEVVISVLRPIRERFLSLISEKGELEKLLKDGADRASAVAEVTVGQMKEKMGLL